jgi:hypothetical protein
MATIWGSLKINYLDSCRRGAALENEFADVKAGGSKKKVKLFKVYEAKIARELVAAEYQ